MPVNAHPRLHAALAALLATLLALVLAACGPDDQPTGEDVPLPSVTNPATKTPGKAGDPAGGGGTDRADRGGRGKDEDGGDGDDDDDGGGSGGSGGGSGIGGGGGSGGGGNDGGGNEGGSGGGSPSGPRAPSIPDTKSTRALSAAADGRLEFEPPGLSAPPGSITLVFTNPSSTEHAIAVKGDDFQSRESARVKDGETTRLTIRVPTGDYSFYCPVGDHEVQGMLGVLSVY